MAAAPLAVPMIIGAGAGAMLDRKNPLRGAMLGAVGGTVAGPAISGLTSAGSAAAGAAGAAGADAGLAASYGAAGTLAGYGPEQAAYLAAQGEGMGSAGLAHALGSGGVNPMLAKGASMAAMGPQGLLAGMSATEKAKLGMQGMGMFSEMAQPQQQQPRVASTPPPSVPTQMEFLESSPRDRPNNRVSALRSIWG